MKVKDFKKALENINDNLELNLCIGSFYTSIPGLEMMVFGNVESVSEGCLSCINNKEKEIGLHLNLKCVRTSFSSRFSKNYTVSIQGISQDHVIIIDNTIEKLKNKLE